MNRLRPPFIAGNWKMNPSGLDEALALANSVKVGVGQESRVRVALCPPSIFLYAVDHALANCPVTLGAQNMHWEAAGAFTGELSAPMLLDSGCTHVILGHSERRHGLGESNEIVNQKVHTAVRAGLIPILCIGETLDERKSNRTESVVTAQLEGSLAGIESDSAAGIVLAYEPVWAIGTGVVATPAQAQDVHAFVRNWLAERFGPAISDRITILYGGSVKADNAQELLACPDLDGALVGGASLKSEDFLGIITAARSLAG
jgi:triosephosphate isomerase